MDRDKLAIEAVELLGRLDRRLDQVTAERDDLRRQVDEAFERMRNALRQIRLGAMDIERGEENPREAAQDIQRLCYAALNNQPIPEIWKLEEPEDDAGT